jgi:hydrogenase/urease accessory protein HupE
MFEIWYAPGTKFDDLSEKSPANVNVAAIVAACAVALAILLPARMARAHTIGLSRGDYRLEGATLSTEIALSQRELIASLPAIDLDHDGWLQAAELDEARGLIASAFVDGVAVSADGQTCSGAFESARPIDAEDGVSIRARYSCHGRPGSLTLAWPLLEKLAPGHRHLARVTVGPAVQDAVVQRGSAPWTLDVAGQLSHAGGTAWAMFKLGIEHILTGADHLVFLLGLILVGGRARSLALVVSAFTLAHSLTLALATLSFITPSPRLVEPLIALSIAYVGVENLFVKDTTKRWRITFPFGLVHGFGFAGALREIALPQAQVPVALVSFNLGVEAGQLGVLALALPLIFAARRAPAFRDRGAKLASLGIAAAGVVWFLVRVAAAA